MSNLDFFKCPSCNVMYSIPRIGCLPGEVIFSDLKVEAPGFDGFLNVLKCEKCNNFFWTEENEVGRDENQSTVITAKDLTIDECLEYLEITPKKDCKHEFFIRLKIIWIYNDRARARISIVEDKADFEKWRDNNMALIDVIDESIINQKFMKAEAYRYLRMFDKSKEILNTINGDENDDDEFNDIDIRARKQQMLDEISEQRNIVFIYND